MLKISFQRNHLLLFYSPRKVGKPVEPFVIDSSSKVIVAHLGGHLPQVKKHCTRLYDYIYQLESGFHRRTTNSL